eukprot:m.230152 g.230152  ORF g.230152 m.230152 type:complete len:51 (+) comp22406_c10_seq3:100-252(+)
MRQKKGERREFFLFEKKKKNKVFPPGSLKWSHLRTPYRLLCGPVSPLKSF